MDYAKQPMPYAVEGVYHVVELKNCILYIHACRIGIGLQITGDLVGNAYLDYQYGRAKASRLPVSQCLEAGSFVLVI